LPATQVSPNNAHAEEQER